MAGRRHVKVTEENGKVYEADVYLPQIRNIIGFLNGTWDLNPYADCFQGKSKLGDVDASIELFGHTMVVEFKRDRTALNQGQIVKAIRQAKFSNITTFFVFGDTNRPVEFLRFSPNCIKGTGYIKTDVTGLRKAFKAWAGWAERNSLIADYDESWAISKKYC